MTTATDPIRQYLEVIDGVCGGRNPLSKFLLAHGQSFEVHYKWPESVPLRRGRMRECFQNALQAVWFHRRFIYCEGYAAGFFPVNHAWVYDTVTERAYDPTWREGSVYFGVPVLTDYTKRCALRTKTYTVVDDWQNNYPITVDAIEEWKAEL